MKKMFLSALACVAFAGSAFASNEVIESIDCTNVEFLLDLEKTDIIENSMKKCVVEVNTRDNWGNITTIVYSTWYPNNAGGDFSCYNYAVGIQRQYDFTLKESTLTKVN